MHAGRVHPGIGSHGVSRVHAATVPFLMNGSVASLSLGPPDGAGAQEEDIFAGKAPAEAHPMEEDLSVDLAEGAPGAVLPVEAAPGEALPKEAAGEAFPEEAPGEAFPEEAPCEAFLAEALGEDFPMEAPCEAFPEEAPWEAFLERAPREAVLEKAPGEIFPEQAPEEVLPEEAPGEALPEEDSGAVLQSTHQREYQVLADILRRHTFAFTAVEMCCCAMHVAVLVMQ